MAPSSPRPSFDAQPTDLELVNNFLRPWVKDGRKADLCTHEADGRKIGPFIHEADVYADDPAVLVRNFAPAVSLDGERVWYFFSPLRSKSERGTRKTRTVATGVGCWHSESTLKAVVSVFGGCEHKLGYRQSLSFVKKDGASKFRTGWLMVEFRLFKDTDAGAVRQPRGEGCSVAHRVLCKVYPSPRKPEIMDGVRALEQEPTPTLATVDEGSELESTDSDETLDEAVASESHKKTGKDEPNTATLLASPRDGKPHGKISGAATAPGRKNKSEADDKDSVESSAAGPERKRKAEDDEGLAADARGDRKRTAAGAPSVDLLCPNCGIHFAATVQVAAPATNSKAEAEQEATEIARVESTPAREKIVEFHKFI